MVRRICWICVLIVSSQVILSSASAEAPKIGGRIMYDYAVYDSDDGDFNTGGEIRRARLFAKGKLDGDWFYKLQYDFTGSGADGFRDAYLGYSGLSFLDSIRIGNTIEYGSLEDSTSSKYITFMERSLPCLAFVPAPRRLGVAVDAHGDNWYAGGGIFGEGAEYDSDDEQGNGASVRAAWIPANEDGKAVHIGAFGQFRTPPGDNEVRYRARPEAHVDGTRLVDTGPISNVNHTAMYGVELALVMGPALLQGEYMAVEVDRDGFSSEQYDGAYISASWFLTGESAAYDAESATFGRVKPLKPVGEDGIGAVAVACRYSTLDLNDGISGGDEDNITVGLNWHPTAKTRFMLNYVNARATVDGVETDVDIVQVRTQFDF